MTNSLQQRIDHVLALADAANHSMKIKVDVQIVIEEGRTYTIGSGDHLQASKDFYAAAPEMIAIIKELRAELQKARNAMSKRVMQFDGDGKITQVQCEGCAPIAQENHHASRITNEEVRMVTGAWEERGGDRRKKDKDRLFWAGEYVGRYPCRRKSDRRRT